MSFSNHKISMVVSLLICIVLIDCRCRDTKSPSVLAMEHCRDRTERELNACWEKDLLKQIEKGNDNDTICQAYLSLADLYVFERREQAAEAVFERLKKGEVGSNCKSYAEKAQKAFAIIRPGLPAPNFRAMDSRNQVIDTKHVNDRTIIYFFWATWCGACKPDYADMAEIMAKYSEKVVVIGVSGDRDRDDFDRTMLERALRWPNIQDGDDFEGPINRLFFVNRYPTIIVVDPKGKIVTDRLRGERLKNFVQQL